MAPWLRREIDMRLTVTLSCFFELANATLTLT